MHQTFQATQPGKHATCDRCPATTLLTKRAFGQLAEYPADWLTPVARVDFDGAFEDEICVIGHDKQDGALVRAAVMVWDDRTPQLRSLPLVVIGA